VDTLTRPGETVGFDYDARDNLVAMSDTLGTTVNTFDALSRLTSTTDPNDFTVGYAYDEAGNLTELTYPGGNTVSYTYDALNRVASVSIDWLNLTATPSYDKAGRLTGIAHFNGTATSYNYDAADRLTGLTHSASGQAIAGYQYTLDPNGNRTQVVVDAEPILPESLINASEPRTYNTLRNRLTDALLDGSPVAFTYDAEGQLQSKGGTSFTFDSANRLTGFGASSYQYDGVGNRLVAMRDGITTQYVYDAAGNLLAEADGTGTITRYYIHGVGLLAMVDAQTDEVYVYHYDGTGHTVAMTDAGQSVVNRYAYSPYGEVLGKDEQVEQPFTYVGQYGVMSEPEGLYYMRARYYDAEVGRFISEDPIGFDGGLNLYAYAGGNPVNAVDPDGDVPVPVVTGIIGGLSGLAGACFDGCSLKEAAIGAGTGAVAGAFGGTARVARFVGSSIVRSAGVGSGLAGFSNATGQGIDLGLRARQGETVALENFSFGQVGLSAVGGALGGAKTAKFGETVVERAAAGFVETTNQLPFDVVGSAIGK